MSFDKTDSQTFITRSVHVRSKMLQASNRSASSPCTLNKRSDKVHQQISNYKAILSLLHKAVPPRLFPPTPGCRAPPHSTCAPKGGAKSEAGESFSANYLGHAAPWLCCESREEFGIDLLRKKDASFLAKNVASPFRPRLRPLLKFRQFRDFLLVLAVP